MMQRGQICKVIKFNPKAAVKKSKTARRIPEEIMEIFNGDNDDLKFCVSHYARSLQARVRVKHLEKSILKW